MEDAGAVQEVADGVPDDPALVNLVAEHVDVFDDVVDDAVFVLLQGIQHFVLLVVGDAFQAAGGKGPEGVDELRVHLGKHAFDGAWIFDTEHVCRDGCCQELQRHTQSKHGAGTHSDAAGAWA